jgi:hypothetical protein
MAFLRLHRVAYTENCRVMKRLKTTATELAAQHNLPFWTSRA